MRTNRSTTHEAFVAAALVAGLALAVGRVARADPPLHAGRPPAIRPDYAGVTLPPNVAPPNFAVEEPGTAWRVVLRGAQGKPIEISSSTPSIVIPIAAWRTLLQNNRGGSLFVDVSVRSADGRWTQFDTITNTIARAEIDRYVVYRQLHSLYTKYWTTGIYQRNLEDYAETTVLDGLAMDHGCVNCHTFLNNSPDRMFIHTRSTVHGNSMVLIEDGRVSNVDSRTRFGGAPLAYSAWHPSGKLISFTSIRVRQIFHSSRPEIRDGVDADSAMGYYKLDTRTVSDSPKLSMKDRLETYPTWSPDGRFLYFCTTPLTWTDATKTPRFYQDIKYSLVRIAYDLATDQWGETEVVLSPEQTGKSITEPRVSPDGRFLLFCMSDYSCIPAFQPSSDIYLMDLSTRQFKRLECNSDRQDTWHSWSSNGRWIAFSSKRLDGIFTRTFFSYLDDQGVAHKPFLLPQRDPTYYDSCIRLQQLPELITKPVPVSAETLAQAVRAPAKVRTNIQADGVTSATIKPQKPPASEPYAPVPRVNKPR